jgi:hypothetical protein
MVRGNALPSLSCIAVDVCETSARLIVHDTNDVPDEFTIVISHSRTAARKCRLIWRGRTDVGVAFETNSPQQILVRRSLEAPLAAQDEVFEAPASIVATA